MSNKHYSAVADAIKLIPDIDTRRNVAQSLAVSFAGFDDRFSVSLFMAACNV